MRFVVLLASMLVAAPAFASGRFAIVVGSNVGAPDRARLWFAERDALRFADSLSELGDFPKEQVTLLEGASLGAVHDAIARVEAQITVARQRGEHTLLVFYFSGHASPTHLELGADKLDYDELRALISRSAADVKVAIVDACDAGSLTQVKGGHAVSTIDFPLPADERVEGVAFVASTAEDESAQESASLGGSFFSHNLDIALRGAGDADGDGLVTLAEAFRYASTRTVAGTTGTEVGAQHPTFSMHMSGRGDVVLADLRRAEARLTIAADPSAQFVVRGPGGFVAQFNGAPTPVDLALPAGHYEIERHRGSARDVAEVDLTRGAHLPVGGFVASNVDSTSTKGGARFGELSLGVVGASSPLPNVGVEPGARLGFRHEVGPVALRLRVGAMHANVTDEWLNYALTSYSAGLGVLYPAIDRRIRVDVGLEAGGAYDVQHVVDGVSHSAGEFSAGPVAAASVALGMTRVGLEVDGFWKQLPIDGETRSALTVEADAFIALEL